MSLQSLHRTAPLAHTPAIVPWHVSLQVDDSYGVKSHAEFLTGYGFLPTTEVDVYSIDLLSLLQSRPDFPEERLGALVRTGGSGVLESLQKVSADQACKASESQRAMWYRSAPQTWIAGAAKIACCGLRDLLGAVHLWADGTCWALGTLHGEPFTSSKSVCVFCMNCPVAYKGRS